jgi:hypothetical protein
MKAARFSVRRRAKVESMRFSDMKWVRRIGETRGE